MKIGNVDLAEGFLYPKVELDLFGPDDESESVIATLDTGFTGWLALPPKVIERLRLPYFRTEKITLADASEINADLHLADVFFAYRLYRVYVASVGTVALVGTSLLSKAKITVDMVPNGDITYAPISP